MDRICAALTLLVLPGLAAQETRPIEELFDGSLLICGGGRLPKEILDRFVELAGDRKARLVVIPTATSRADDPNYDAKKPFAGYDVASIDVVHTRDRSRADTGAFVELLARATGVWIVGGQQSRLGATYASTRVEAELRGVIRRGGVVAGSSAGAAIQSKIMIAGGRNEPRMATGFDLLPGSVIDQHFTQRKRLPRLVHAITKHPSRVGFGVDEQTALWIRGRQLRVLGPGTVSVVLAGSAFRKPRVEVVAANPRPLDWLTLRRAARVRGGRTDPGHQPQPPVVAKGTLVLVGGGAVPREIWQRFVTAAGGDQARIVVVPTAGGSTRGASRVVATLKRLGVTDVVVRHETARAKIETEAFLAPLRRATGIWFGGGRQWRLVDAYEGTKALPLFHDVLARGGVIGGSSAGTSIQGQFMARGNPLGNRAAFVEGYEEGFGFLPGTAIDQHFSQRRRAPDLKLLAKTYPKLLGIGIDESTAVVVRGTRIEVVGAGKVVTSRAGAWRELTAGQVFELAPPRKK